MNPHAMEPGIPERDDSEAVYLPRFDDEPKWLARAMEPVNLDRDDPETVYLPSFDDEPRWLAQAGSPSEMSTWLHTAWEEQVRVELFRGALRRAEASRDRALALARYDGVDEIDLGHGTIRMVVGPCARMRVLDTARFETEYPDAFRKIARSWVKIADAERAVGKLRVADCCTIREGAHRLGLVYEPRCNQMTQQGEET